MCKLNGTEIRTKEINGEIWVVLRDVLQAMGYSKPINVTTQMRKYLYDIKKQDVLVKSNKMLPTYINREGLSYLMEYASRAPGYRTHVTSWTKYLSELDGTLKREKQCSIQPELPKIDAKATAGIPGSNARTLHNTITSWEAAISAFQGVIAENEALKKSEETLKQEIQRLNTEIKKLYKDLTQCNTAYISVSSENSRLQGIVNQIQKTVKDVA